MIRIRLPRRHTPLLTALFALLALGLATAAEARRPIGVAPSPWWEEVKRIEGSLDKGRYKSVAKAAPRLAREITGKSWEHPDLPAIFAELTLMEAVALVYQDEPKKAIWRWHTAVVLDRKLLKRDLSRYGEKAADLFREYPPRKRGEIPHRWARTVHGPIVGESLERPRKLEEVAPVVLQSSGVSRDGATRPLHIEAIIDETAQLNEPVLVHPLDVHPAVAWAVLRWVPVRKYAAGKLDGEARPFLFQLEVHFQVLRGASEARHIE